MTVSVQAIRVQYTGNGSTTAYGFAFQITLATDLLVSTPEGKYIGAPE